MRKRIYSYKVGSKGARTLSRASNIILLKHTNSIYRPRSWDKIINWGSSVMQPRLLESGATIFNRPELADRCANKLKFYRLMQEHGIRVPTWTTNRGEVIEWLDGGDTVFARTLLTGHSGRGIIKVEPDDIDGLYPLDILPRAAVYTKYFKKKEEYRLHFYSYSTPVGTHSHCFFKQRKAKRRDTDTEDVDYQVRTYDNGFKFVFGRDLGPVPEVVEDAAEYAFFVSGLDFGAVDVMYNEHCNEACVVEINTAPALEGETTINNYVGVVNQLINN